MTICQRVRAEFDAVVMKSHKDLAELSLESQEHMDECMQCRGHNFLKLHYSAIMSAHLAAADAVHPKVISHWGVLCTSEVIRLSNPYKGV